MSEKELQLFERLIDMLGGAGDGAFWLIIAWIGRGYFNSLLFALTILTIIYLIYRGICWFNDFQGLADDVRRTAGCPNPHGEVLDSERRRVLKLIEKGRAAEADHE